MWNRDVKWWDREVRGEEIAKWALILILFPVILIFIFMVCLFKSGGNTLRGGR